MIYLITYKTGVCHSHGDYRDETILLVNKAFSTKQLAKEYKEKNLIYGDIIEIEVDPDNLSNFKIPKTLVNQKSIQQQEDEIIIKNIMDAIRK